MENSLLEQEAQAASQQQYNETQQLVDLLVRPESPVEEGEESPVSKGSQRQVNDLQHAAQDMSLLGKKKKKKKKKAKKKLTENAMLEGEMIENQLYKQMSQIEEVPTEQEVQMTGMQSPLSQQVSGAELNFIKQLKSPVASQISIDKNVVQMEVSVEKVLVLQEVPIVDVVPEQFEQFELVPVMDDRDDLEAPEPLGSDRALLQKQEDFEPVQNPVAQNGVPLPNSSIGKSETQQYLVLHKRMQSEEKVNPDEDSDEGQGIFERDAETGLSYERMEYMRNLNHPREVHFDISTGSNTFVEHPICKTATGWSHYNKDWRKSDLTQYGSGIVLYFQFLKYLGVMMILFYCLSLPNLILFFHGNLKEGEDVGINSESFSAQGLQDLLYMFTFGNLGEQHTVCQLTNFTENAAILNMKCNYGAKMTGIVQFGQILKENANVTKDDCLSIYDLPFSPPECNYRNLKNIWSKLDYQFEKDCYYKESCDINLEEILTDAWGEQDYRPVQCSQNNALEKIKRKQMEVTDIWNYSYQMSIECLPRDIFVPFLEKRVSRDILSLFCVLSDLLITFLLYVSLLSLKNFQDLTKADVQEYMLTADDFTVCIKQLPSADEKDLKELKAYLVSWVEKVLEKEDVADYKDPFKQQTDQNQNNVMNIYFGMDEYWKMKILLEISQLLKQKKILQKRATRFGEDNQAKIDVLNEKAVDMLEKMKKEEQSRWFSAKPVILFIQCQCMNGVKKFTNALNISMIKRFFYICTCRKKMIKHKYLNGTIWPKIYSPAEPSSIQWENLGCGPTNRLLRRQLVNLIALVIMILGFALIAVGKDFTEKSQDKDSKKKFDIAQCPDLNSSKEEAFADFKNDDADITIGGCYCLKMFLEKREFDEANEFCKTWMTQYLLKKLQPLIVALAIAITNAIQQLSFGSISKFERNHSITENLISSMTKIFVVMYLNTAIILILMYALIEELDVPESFPILQGKFKKFSVEWYQVVGSTIMMTMIVQVFAPHASYLFKPILKCLIRCYDRKCSIDEKQTRQLLQEDYEAKYMGAEYEIDKRFAQILSQVLIVLTFASGMPLLYLIGMISCFTSYWTDKILFLRLYKRPPLYDDGMAVRARKILKLSIIVHCLMSIYMYSNDTILNYKQKNDVYYWIDQNIDGFLESGFRTNLQELKLEVMEKARSLNEYFSLYKSHSLLYMFGLFWFLIIVLLEEMFGFLQAIGTAFSYCCLGKRKQQQEQINEAFTNANSLKIVETEVPMDNKVEPMNLAPEDVLKDLEQQLDAQAFKGSEIEAAGTHNVSPEKSFQHEEQKIEGPVETAPQEQLRMPVENMISQNQNLQKNQMMQGIQKQMSIKLSTRLQDFRQYQNVKRMIGENFSTNIYQDISLENLRKEYDKVQIELMDEQYDKTSAMKYVNHLEEGMDYRAWYRQRCLQKLTEMRQVVQGHIMSRNLRPPRQRITGAQADLNSTANDFDLAQKSMKSEANYFRLRSIYCFDILEHPTYVKANKVLKRIRRFESKE